MKKLLTIFTILFSIGIYAQTPRAGGINNLQATVQSIVHDNFVGVQTTNSNAFAVYSFATSFDYNLGLKSTDNISEGTTNKYFSVTLARNAFGSGTGLNYSAGIYSLDSTVLGTLASVPGKFNIPTGSTSDYLRGDGTPAAFPTIPSIYTPTDYIITRSINNTNYTISITKSATIRYNIKISCTATIGSASTGKVLFQYSTNGGTTWIDAGEVENSNTVTLAIVLNSTTTQSGFITWNVPANALCRLVPTSTGTTTITWIRGQETY